MLIFKFYCISLAGCPLVTCLHRLWFEALRHVFRAAWMVPILKKEETTNWCRSLGERTVTSLMFCEKCVETTYTWVTGVNKGFRHVENETHSCKASIFNEKINLVHVLMEEDGWLLAETIRCLTLWPSQLVQLAWFWLNNCGGTNCLMGVEIVVSVSALDRGRIISGNFNWMGWRSQGIALKDSNERKHSFAGTVLKTEHIQDW